MFSSYCCLLNTWSYDLEIFIWLCWLKYDFRGSEKPEKDDDATDDDDDGKHCDDKDEDEDDGSKDCDGGSDCDDDGSDCDTNRSIIDCLQPEAELRSTATSQIDS